MKNVLNTYKFKLFIIAITIDLLLYLLIFHSGIVLPYINPSVEDYKPWTSFPRDAGQKMAWYILHIPTSMLISGEGYELLSVVQTGLIFLGLGAIIDYKKNLNKNKQEEQ